MQRRVKQLSGVIVLLAILVVCGWQGWRLLRANDRVKVLLLEAVQPHLNTQLDIRSMKVGFNTISIQDVVLLSDDRLFALEVDEIQVGYSFRSLIANRFQPYRAAESITVVRPRLHLNSGFQGAASANDTSVVSVYDILDAYGAIQEELTFIRRILLQDASVYWYDSEGASTTLAQDVNGWVDKQSRQQVRLGIDGRFLNADRQNFKIIGQLNYETDQHAFDLDIQDYALEQVVPFYTTDAFRFTTGTLTGAFHVTADAAMRTRNRIDVEGRLALSDVGMQLTPNQFPVEHITMVGELLDNNLTFTEFFQEYHDSRLEYSGRILNIFDPALELQMTATGVLLEDLQADYFPDLQPGIAGEVDVKASVSGPVADPTLKGTVSTPAVSIGDQEWRHAHSLVELQKTGVTIQAIRFESDNTTCEGSVAYNFGVDEDIYLLLEAYHDVGWLAAQVPEARDVEKLAYLRIGLTGRRQDLSGRFALDVTGGRHEIALSGDMRYVDDTFMFQGLSEVDRFAVTGQIDTRRKVARVDSVTNPFVLLNALVETPYLRTLDRSYDTRFDWSMTDSGMQWRGSGRSTDRYEKRRPPQFTLDGGSELNGAGRRYRSILEYTPSDGEPFTLDVALEQQGQHWQIQRLQAPGLFSAEGSYVQADSPKVAGNIAVSSRFEDIARLLGISQWQDHAGEVLGDIVLSGNFHNPVTDVALQFSDVTLGQVAGYDGILEGSSKDGLTYDIEKLEFRYQDVPAFWGWGALQPAADSMFLQLHGRDIDADLVFATLDAEQSFVEGRIAFDLDIEGSLQRPDFTGTAAISEGRFGKIPFEQLNIAFADTPVDGPVVEDSTATPRTRVLPNGLWLRDVTLQQFENLRFTGGGYLPLNDRESMDISFRGTGDLLHLLDDLDPFFERTTGQGSADLRFTGTLEQPRLESGRLRIQDGDFRMKASVRRMRNVTADVELRSGERFIRFNEMTARVKGEPVAIRNAPAVPVTLEDGRPFDLKPMVFMDDGLTWGILILETGKNGMTGHIPRMMPEGEELTLFLSGLNKDEDFYLAGPLDEPRLRGTIRAEDMEYTYPFLPSSRPNELTLTERILSMMRMDLRLLTLDNNRYQSTVDYGISTISDNVEIDLILERDTETGLRFTGVLEDETFAIDGVMSSSRGSIDYMDFTFRPEHIAATFSGSVTEAGPVLSGRAWSTVRDTIPYDVYLEIYSRDKESGRESNAGAWENVEFRLSSNMPSRQLAAATEQSQEEIFSSLGYGTENLGTRGGEMVGARADNMLLRPLFRPLERGLRGFFGLDEFRFRPSITRGFARNFAESAFGNASGAIYTPMDAFNTWNIFQSSSVMLGKSFLSDFYFSYSGRVVQGFQTNGVREGLAFNHQVGLEYRIGPGLLMEVQYDYQRDRTLYGREDARVWFRHYFDLW